MGAALGGVRTAMARACSATKKVGAAGTEDGFGGVWVRSEVGEVGSGEREVRIAVAEGSLAFASGRVECRWVLLRKSGEEHLGR